MTQCSSFTRIAFLTVPRQLALASGAAAYRGRRALTKAPVSPSMLLNPDVMEDGANIFFSLEVSRTHHFAVVQRDRSHRPRPTVAGMPKGRSQGHRMRM